MLRVVPSTKESWERRSDESEDEYLSFVMWLHSEKPRSAPPNALATSREWGPRARAFDRATTAPRSTKDRIANATRALCVLADLEAAKLLRRAEQTEGECLTVKEQITLMAYLTGLSKLNDLITEKDEIDVSKLSVEELRTIHAARTSLARAAK